MRRSVKLRYEKTFKQLGSKKLCTILKKNIYCSIIMLSFVNRLKVTNRESIEES